MLSSPTISFQNFSTLTPLQASIAQALSGNLAMGSQLGNTGDVVDALHSALTTDPTQGISPEATSSYVNQSVATPLLRQFDQQILPRLKDSFASVGALMGSRRAFATQTALENLQSTIAAEMGKARLANQQLSAQLREQMAQRQGQLVGQQQQTALGYNQIGLGLTGQSHMGVQPIRSAIGGISPYGMPSNFSFGQRPLGILQQPQANPSGYAIAGWLPQDQTSSLGDFNKYDEQYA